MQYDWILDVLSDLKNFARANDLSSLAEQLDDTALIAAAEIASRNGDGTPDDEDIGRSERNPERSGQHQLV